jgi:cytochrome c oxidase subunit IV
MMQILMFGIAWLVLLALLGVSWGSAYLPLGQAHAFLPLGIAAVQALIIALVFMQLGRGARVKWLFAGVGFYWLMIMIALSATDYLTRSGFPFAGGT